MSKLSGIIHPIEGFQYSVNIAYDLYDDNKIKAFIPTSGTLHIIIFIYLLKFRNI